MPPLVEHRMPQAYGLVIQLPTTVQLLMVTAPMLSAVCRLMPSRALLATRVFVRSPYAM